MPWGIFDYGTDQVDYQYHYPDPAPNLSSAAASAASTTTPTTPVPAAKSSDSGGLDWQLFWAALADTGAAFNNRNGGLMAAIMDNRVKRKRLEIENRLAKNEEDKVTRENLRRQRSIEIANQYRSGGPIGGPFNPLPAGGMGGTPSLPQVAAQTAPAEVGPIEGPPQPPATQEPITIGGGREIPGAGAVGQVDLGTDGFINADPTVDEYQPGGATQPLGQVANNILAEREVWAQRAEAAARAEKENGNLKGAEYYIDQAKRYRSVPDSLLPFLPKWQRDAIVKRGGTTIEMPKEQSAFAKKYGEKAATQFFDVELPEAKTARQSIKNTNDLIKMMDQGIITGWGAPVFVGVSKALNQMGIDLPWDEETTNTQAYMAAAGKQVAQEITAFGSSTALSDADREYAAKIAGGDISIDERALRKLFNIYQKTNLEKLIDFNERAKEYKADAEGLRVGFDLDIPEVYYSEGLEDFEPYTGKPLTGSSNSGSSDAVVDWNDYQP